MCWHQVPILAFALLLALATASAQEPVKVSSVEIWSHKIGSYLGIHSKTKVGPQQDAVTLQVITDEFGNVEDAKPVAGPQEFFDEAVQAESRKKFKPFEQNGVPIRASFEDYVPILPPEQWSGNNVPFPEIKDWSTLNIRLKRTPCFGSCPAYTVEIRGNGEVVFDGDYNVLMTDVITETFPENRWKISSLYSAAQIICRSKTAMN